MRQSEKPIQNQKIVFKEVPLRLSEGQPNDYFGDMQSQNSKMSDNTSRSKMVSQWRPKEQFKFETHGGDASLLHLAS